MSSDLNGAIYEAALKYTNGGTTSALTTGQVSVAATATLIVAARTSGGAVTIINGGTVDVFLGGATVTTTTGVLLPGTKGASVTLPTQAAIYGIVGTGTEPVSYAAT